MSDHKVRIDVQSRAVVIEFGTPTLREVYSQWKDWLIENPGAPLAFRIQDGPHGQVIALDEEWSIIGNVTEEP